MESETETEKGQSIAQVSTLCKALYLCGGAVNGFFCDTCLKQGKGNTDTSFVTQFQETTKRRIMGNLIGNRRMAPVSIDLPLGLSMLNKFKKFNKQLDEINLFDRG